MTGMGEARPDPDPVPLSELSYTQANRELDEIVAFFEQREIDVDQLVARLERATAIVDELDRRIRRTRMQVEELVPRLEAAARSEQAVESAPGAQPTREADHQDGEEDSGDAAHDHLDGGELDEEGLDEEELEAWEDFREEHGAGSSPDPPLF